MPTNADLGRAIRRLRRAQRLTIEVLALDADMHPTYLSGIERGIRNPTWSKITDLTRALGVPLTGVVEAAEDEAEVARVVREARAHIDLARRYDD
jgi:transcriptional regulator with XRE-family HTH domain